MPQPVFGRQSSARVLAATFFGIVIGCSGGESDAEKQTSSDTSALRACVTALRAAESADPIQRIALVARGCSAAHAGLHDYAAAVQTQRDPYTVLFERFDFACSDKARTAFNQAPLERRMQRLHENCGDHFYGIVDGRSDLLSHEWFVLNRINLWLQPTTSRSSDNRLRHDVAEATAITHFPLPLPAQGPHYVLPSSEAGQRRTATFYVVVGVDDVSAGAVPVTRLRGPELELRPVPGGPFPGVVLRRDDAAAHLRELEGMLAAIHGRHDVANDVLYMADAALPATRLVDVGTSLGHASYAVAVSGDVALTHSIRFEALSALGSAAPTLVLSRNSIVFNKQARSLDSGVTRTQVSKELAAELTQRAPSGHVEVELAESATVGDLIGAADIIARAGGDTAVLARAP